MVPPLTREVGAWLGGPNGGLLGGVLGVVIGFLVVLTLTRLEKVLQRRPSSAPNQPRRPSKKPLLRTSQPKRHRTSGGVDLRRHEPGSFNISRGSFNLLTLAS